MSNRETDPAQTMDKAYNPAEHEEAIYQTWEEGGYFKPRPGTDSAKPPYVIVIPPPNVTGILHMGHVLDNALQDILIRWQRMMGTETLWVPGCDHAGIATQNNVARKLREEGRDPEEMGREKFLEAAWSWKDQYHDRITGQLKRLGCSCDWERERFTLDEGLSRSVAQVFIDLYNEGLIYRGEYIVNWDPHNQTALSDEEVIYEEVAGKLWYFRYPMADGDGHLVVATTRPETMLGDTGVAINPDDAGKDPFRGRRVKLPLVGREIPIIEDSFVDPEFGTGFVKVTPAHDPNDFEMGQRHKLENVIVIGPDGRMTEQAGKYAGLTREEARQRIVADLEAAGLVEKIEDYTHSVGHGQRSGVPIEPYLSTQWYVRMESLAAPAIAAVKNGEIKFTPARWEKTYFHWLDNIRDWCISRQLWWGHRIPVWTNSATGEETAALEKPAGEGWVQDPDVLDTWFSSWLWPFSILGWPDETEDLKRYYPSSTLVTGPDIIFFWVARMIMAGLRFADNIPFRNIFLHGIVRDSEGRKMSKSLGNSPDPMDLMAQYGVDAVRFSMVMLTPLGGDYLFEDTHMEMGRNFANKIWNASRFTLSQLDKFDLNFDGVITTSTQGENPEIASETPLERWLASEWLPVASGVLSEPSAEDLWILSRLESTCAAVQQDLESFRFNDAARALYDFLWKEYCDWYLELTKPRVYGDDPQAAATALITSAAVLHATLRLLHPFMPYITEAIWSKIPGSKDRIIVAPWPSPPAEFKNVAAVADMELWMETISSIRGMRKELGLKPGQTIELIFRSDLEGRQQQMERCRPFLASLARVGEFRFEDPGAEKPKPAASAFLPGLEIWLPLSGLIDLNEERGRLTKELAKTTGELRGVEGKLASKGFLAKAPADVVESARKRCDLAREKVAKLTESLANLQEDG